MPSKYIIKEIIQMNYYIPKFNHFILENNNYNIKLIIPFSDQRKNDLNIEQTLKIHNINNIKKIEDILYLNNILHSLKRKKPFNFNLDNYNINKIIKININKSIEWINENYISILDSFITSLKLDYFIKYKNKYKEILHIEEYEFLIKLYERINNEKINFNIKNHLSNYKFYYIFHYFYILLFNNRRDLIKLYENKDYINKLKNNKFLYIINSVYKFSEKELNGFTYLNYTKDDGTVIYDPSKYVFYGTFDEFLNELDKSKNELLGRIEFHPYDSTNPNDLKNILVYEKNENGSFHLTDGNYKLIDNNYFLHKLIFPDYSLNFDFDENIIYHNFTSYLLLSLLNNNTAFNKFLNNDEFNYFRHCKKYFNANNFNDLDTYNSDIFKFNEAGREIELFITENIIKKYKKGGKTKLNKNLELYKKDYKNLLEYSDDKYTIFYAPDSKTSKILSCGLSNYCINQWKNSFDGYFEQGIRFWYVFYKENNNYDYIIFYKMKDNSRFMIDDKLQKIANRLKWYNPGQYPTSLNDALKLAEDNLIITNEMNNELSNILIQLNKN